MYFPGEDIFDEVIPEGSNSVTLVEILLVNFWWEEARVINVEASYWRLLLLYTHARVTFTPSRAGTG